VFLYTADICFLYFSLFCYGHQCCRHSSLSSVRRPLNVEKGVEPTFAMFSALRRRVPTISHQKTVTYGLNTSRRQTESPRPIHRQFAALLTSGPVRLRPRYAFPVYVALRHIHARSLSYSSIPKFVARAFRVPVAVGTVGAGGFAYAHYKIEGESPNSVLNCDIRNDTEDRVQV
jgi:hypothetical protein